MRVATLVTVLFPVVALCLQAQTGCTDVLDVIPEPDINSAYVVCDNLLASSKTVTQYATTVVEARATITPDPAFVTTVIGTVTNTITDTEIVPVTRTLRNYVVDGARKRNLDNAGISPQCRRLTKDSSLPSTTGSTASSTSKTYGPAETTSACLCLIGTPREGITTIYVTATATNTVTITADVVTSTISATVTAVSIIPETIISEVYIYCGVKVCSQDSPGAIVQPGIVSLKLCKYACIGLDGCTTFQFGTTGGVSTCNLYQGQAALDVIIASQGVCKTYEVSDARCELDR